MTGATKDINQRINRVQGIPGLRFLPVRHHSPACANHIRSLILRDRPDVVLVEGPSDGDELIPFLVSSTPPVAFYAYYVDPGSVLTQKERAKDVDRYRCFYPFADFSPEFVALHTASEIQAETHFIDLPYSALLALSRDRDRDLSSHDRSRVSDRPVAESDAVRMMVQKNGCRDFNELWDRFFESGAGSQDSDAFFRDLLAFMMLLRNPGDSKIPKDDTEHRETVYRERYMAGRIISFLGAGKSVYVITGGFHTEAIAGHVADKITPAPGISGPAGEQGIHLVPYTLNRLDAANGYAAGIPNCGYYQRLWQSIGSGARMPHEKTGNKIAGEVCRELMKHGEPAGFPDSLEAVVLSRRLGELRGVRPGRPEILDALECAFIKEEYSPDAPVVSLIRQVLGSHTTGKIPKGLPMAPIVANFRALCKKFKLPLIADEPKVRNLDIYRSLHHRAISRFFHQLSFLNIPFAEFKAGPDFSTGENTDRVREIWGVIWRPETEALLTECMKYGGQIPDAAMNLLIERSGNAKDASQSATLLIHGLMMGMHGLIKQMIVMTETLIMKESDLVRLTDCVKRLFIACSAQNVLDTQAVPELGDLIRKGFDKACSQLSWIGETDEERQFQLSESIHDLNTLALAGHIIPNQTFFVESIEKMYQENNAPVIRGTGAGILASRRVWDTEQTGLVLKGVCEQANHEAGMLGAFLSGFLPVAGKMFIRKRDLVSQVTHTMGAWDESIFMKVLPTLRLAFAGLRPGETLALARTVRCAFDTRREENKKSIVWGPGELALMKNLHGQVKASLKPWGIT